MRKCAPLSLILRTKAFESVIASLIAGLDVWTFKEVTLAHFKTVSLIKVLLKLLILDLLNLFNLLKFCSIFRGAWAIFELVPLSLRHAQPLLFGFAFAYRMIVNKFCPLFAIDVVFFEFFTNFLIEVSLRTFTKIIEIIDVKRGSLTNYRWGLDHFRVCDRRLPLDALTRVQLWHFIPAQGFIDLRNVIVDRTLSFKLRDLPIVRLIFCFHLQERHERFLLLDEIADLI